MPESAYVLFSAFFNYCAWGKIVVNPVLGLKQFNAPYHQIIIADIYHLSTPLRDCFFSLLSYSATRFREYIRCCMYRTAIFKNDSTAEKRGEKEAFALASIAHYCFVETNLNCGLLIKGQGGFD